MLRRISLPSLIQYLALLVGAVWMAADLYQEGGPWWLAVILCSLLAWIYDRWPGGRYDHAYFVAHLALFAALLALHPAGMMVGFSFSAEALGVYPNRAGWRWLAALMFVALALLMARYGAANGFIIGLGVNLGYLSFGYFSFARIDAENARRHSQALLAELQDAHRQLQAYAAQVEEMAVQAERARLAREMHDTLGHHLTVASVQLEGAQRLVSADPQRAAQMIAVVREQVGEALAELRRAVAALRLPLEADLPLETALRRLALSFEAASGVSVQLALPEQPPALPGPQRLALYRAAQEGLTNIQRHAHARHAWLVLACEPDQVRLTVADDGAGFSTTAPEAGFGLRGLRERAALLDGRLEIGPRPGGGAQLVLRLPAAPVPGRDVVAALDGAVASNE